jgi:hypothetical protein
MEFIPSYQSSEKSSSAYGDYEAPKLSKLESQLRSKRLTSDETIKTLIKMLETQLQRIDLSVRLDINSEDPLLRVLEAVKSCVDEIMEVKEKLKMNSFVSFNNELDRSQSQSDISIRVTAEKLSSANKQLRHFERLLNKKEKSIIEKEKLILTQQKELEKEKEQIEITKSRLQNIEETGVHAKFTFKDDSENVRSLATRLAIEKQSLETKKSEIAEQVHILEAGIERLEREKLANNDLIEENKKLLETMNREKTEVLETKKFIEKQKAEMLEIKANNEKLLNLVTKERSNLKIEEEKVLRQKFDLDAKVVYFNREKNELAKNSAEVESERGKLAQEKEMLQKVRHQLGEEKEMIKHEYYSLEEIKEQLAAQNQLDFEAKERTLQQREEELEGSIIDLKIQVESYNSQMEEREQILRDREEKIKENEKQIKVSCANIRLAEMSLIESKSQCEEIMQSLLPKIENCYEELEGILRDAFETKIKLDNIFSAGPGKFVCAHCNYSISQSGKNDTAEFKGNMENVNAEIHAKIRFLTSKEEEARLQELKNLATADKLQRAVTEFEENKRLYEEEIIADKEKLRKNFTQLDNSLKMIKEKEAELNMMKNELAEKEKILRIWEQEFSIKGK